MSEPKAQRKTSPEIAEDMRLMIEHMIQMSGVAGQIKKTLITSLAGRIQIPTNRIEGYIYRKIISPTAEEYLLIFNEYKKMKESEQRKVKMRSIIKGLTHENLSDNIQSAASRCAYAGVHGEGGLSVDGLFGTSSLLDQHSTHEPDEMLRDPALFGFRDHVGQGAESRASLILNRDSGRLIQHENAPVEYATERLVKLAGIYRQNTARVTESFMDAAHDLGLSGGCSFYSRTGLIWRLGPETVLWTYEERVAGIGRPIPTMPGPITYLTARLDALCTAVAKLSPIRTIIDLRLGPIAVGYQALMMPFGDGTVVGAIDLHRLCET